MQARGTESVFGIHLPFVWFITGARARLHQPPVAAFQVGLNSTRIFSIQYAVSDSCSLTLFSYPIAVPAAPAQRRMSEFEIVARAREGDLAAFEELYEKHKGRVYALSLRLVKNPARAEDMTQEAFVRAWEKLSTFRGRSSFSTWLHRVTVNTVLGRLRSDRRWEDRTTDLGTHEFRLTTSTPRRPNLELDLEQAIRSLPTQARLVFVLHDVEGYQHTEVADLLGIAEGTSKAHLHRARRLLREVLSP